MALLFGEDLCGFPHESESTQRRSGDAAFFDEEILRFLLHAHYPEPFVFGL